MEGEGGQVALIDTSLEVLLSLTRSGAEHDDSDQTIGILGDHRFLFVGLYIIKISSISGRNLAL